MMFWIGVLVTLSVEVGLIYLSAWLRSKVSGKPVISILGEWFKQ